MLLHGANPVFIQGKISSILPARARAATQKNCNSMNENPSSHFLSQGLGPRSLRFDYGRHLRIDEMGFPVKLHRSNRSANVRFGSKADIEAVLPDVRFTPNSGHWN